MKLSLVIPCYNEADNLPLLLERCQKLTAGKDIEVILVDNGSTDTTPQKLIELLPNYPHCRSIRIDVNQGYGFGILQGLKAAQSDIIGWTHADLQTDPQDVLRGFEFFKKHGPNIFVKGRRYGRPLSDVLFTIGMSIFETLLLRRFFWDINAQPTLFPKKFFQSWQNAPHDFALDLYAYYVAKNNKLPVYRFPVNFGKRLHGMSKWNINWQSKKKFILRTVTFSLKLKSSLK